MACTITLANGFVLTPDTYSVATHKVSAETTNKPVEDGATITDHVIVAPRSLSLSLIVAPFGPNAAVQPPPADGRPEFFWGILLLQLETRQPMTIDCDGQTYTPAVATSLEWSHVYDDGLARRISLEVQEILIATAQTVPAAQVATNIKHKTKTMDLGKVQASRADARVTAVTQALQGQFLNASILALGSIL